MPVAPASYSLEHVGVSMFLLLGGESHKAMLGTGWNRSLPI